MCSSDLLFFKSRFDGLIETLGNRIMFGKHSNPIVMVEEYGDMVVAHIYLNELPDMLRDVDLRHSPLMSEHNIMVMMVKDRNGEAHQAKAATVLKEHDIIMVLGHRRDIREVFEHG